MELAIIIVLLGLIFDYTNGFHDAANVVSTVIATRVLRPFTAILLAAIFNFIGATQISGVAQTIATGLIDSCETSQLVVLSALIGAISWNLLTWYYGIPSSSSYALIGGLIGASWIHAGFSSILMKGVINKVILPMIFSPLIGFFIAYIFMKGLYLSRSKNGKIYRTLQIVSAMFIALSHGLNDAQKSMGIITLGLFTSGIISTPSIPIWVVFACAATIGLGTASGGFRIIQTLGFSITKIEPIQGFAAESSSSIVILAASYLGMPISSTHMITGSITGVGAAKSVRAVSWNIPKKLVAAWLLTLPGASLIGAFCYLVSNHFYN